MRGGTIVPNVPRRPKTNRNKQARPIYKNFIYDPFIFAKLIIFFPKFDQLTAKEMALSVDPERKCQNLQKCKLLRFIFYEIVTRRFSSLSGFNRMKQPRVDDG